MTNEPGHGDPGAWGSPRAVFLSYASQDAGAALKICETLRAAGVEVWFDQSELRGGEAWDAAIRKQIKACALFMPVISANTRARVEGYFRFEWKLAVDRSHLMATEKAFLLPVVIDQIDEADARVPDRFREVQWKRLPGGETPPAFVDQVLRLLTPEVPDVPAVARPPAGASVDRGAAGAGTAPPPTGADRAPAARAWTTPALLLLAVALVGAVSYIAVDRWRLSKRDGAPAQATAPAAQSVAGEPGAIPEKSIAVLPFVDMSEKRDQEYFSDGLAEEPLDLLAQVPDLRVSARTSSFYFKGKSEDVARIARTLRVAHVLEGSVRKAGSTIRVTAQLIRADNGYHLWSKTYDRDVKDIFKVQDEIAAAVVDALKSKLLPTQPASNSHRNVNPEAYNQYLLGRQFITRTNGREARLAAQAFRKATALDPAYAAAWAGVADAMYWVADDAVSATALEADRREATAAAEKAVALQPTLAYGYVTRGLIRATTEWDFVGADKDFQRALALEPDNADVLMNYAGAVLGPTMRLDAAVAMHRKSVVSDPLNARAWSWLGYMLMLRGDLVAARDALNSSLEISPEQSYTPNSMAISFILEGQPAAALESSQRSSAEVFRLFGAAVAQQDLGHAKESEQQLQQLIAKYAFGAAYQIAEVYAWRGDSQHAFEWLERARVQRDAGLCYLKADPLFRKVRGDARYPVMLKTLNLQ